MCLIATRALFSLSLGLVASPSRLNYSGPSSSIWATLALLLLCAPNNSTLVSSKSNLHYFISDLHEYISAILFVKFSLFIVYRSPSIRCLVVSLNYMRCIIFWLFRLLEAPPLRSDWSENNCLAEAIIEANEWNQIDVFIFFRWFIQRKWWMVNC